MSKPISPDDVLQLKKAQLPPEVLEAFNDCIVQNWDGYRAVFQQTAVVRAIRWRFEAVGRHVSREDVYGSHWLDVEDVYREAGWKVEYDKPGFDESYPVTFAFSRAR